MKKLLPLLLIAALLLAACGSAAETESEATRIVFNGSAVEIHGGGAKDEGAVVKIGSAGSYVLSGSGEERQVVVDTGDNPMEVTLILEGLTLSNSGGAVIHIVQAGNFRLQLAEGTDNTLISGDEAMLGSVDPEQSGAALYSEDDMDIEGSGRLTVCGYLNNGIACKDDLDINAGVVTVVAANNGVKGNDSVEIKGGVLNITAQGDGIKSAELDTADKGFITISGGDVTVVSDGDGIQAATDLRITGGTLAVTARGDGESASSKALKAGRAFTLEGGSVLVSSQEDGLRAQSVRVLGGSLELRALGDGIQSGVKGSGVGDVSIEGGTLLLLTGKQAVQPEGLFLVTGGELTAVIGSTKQIEPQTVLPRLFCAIKGAAGDTLRIGEHGPGVEAAFSYKTVLRVGAELVSGESVVVSNGTNTVSALVK